MFQPTFLMGRRAMVTLETETIEGVVVSIGPRITIIDKGRPRQISLGAIVSITATEPLERQRQLNHRRSTTSWLQVDLNHPDGQRRLDGRVSYHEPPPSIGRK